MSRRVAVFGATGAQGAPVVDAALARGFRVRAVARTREAVSARHGDAVDACGADLLDPERLAVALENVDAAFFHLPLPNGPDQPQRQLGNLLAAARRAALPLLVFSTSGASGPRYRQVPLIAGNSAASTAVLGSGVPAIVLSPTVYLENLRVPPIVPRLVSEGVLDYPPIGAEQRMSWTSQLDQALIAAAALDRPDLAGRRFEIATAGAVTGAELAALLGPVLGRPVRYAPQTAEAFGAALGTAFGNPMLGEVLTGLYQAMRELGPTGLALDTDSIAREFALELPSIASRLAAWRTR